MLAYECKQCGKITVLCYKNDYNEYFCSTNCYEKYCKNNNYEFQSTHIHKIKNALNNI